MRVSFKVVLWGIVGGATLVVLWACDTDSIVGIDEGDDETVMTLQQITYALDPQTNEGRVPDGLSVQALFQEINDEQVLVTLAVEDTLNPGDIPPIHPVHVREGEVDSSDVVKTRLTPIDRAAHPAGRSTTLLEASFDEVLEWDAHLTVHQGAAAVDTVIASGEVGANSTASPTGFQLRRVEGDEPVEYPLSATGEDGLSGSVQGQALTPEQTLVTVSIESGTPDTLRTYPVHLRESDASTDGETAFFLGALDGAANSLRTYAVLDLPFDDFRTFDGHVRVFPGNDALDAPVSTGNIGANANGE